MAWVYISPGRGQPSEPSPYVLASAERTLTLEGSTPRPAAASATIGSMIAAGRAAPPLISGGDAEAGAPRAPEPSAESLEEQAAATKSAASVAKAKRNTA